MSNNAEHREEKSFGLNRGLLTRLVPITLFVGLGSFAVVQSMIGDKNESLAQAEQAADATTDSPKLISDQEALSAPNDPPINKIEPADQTNPAAKTTPFDFSQPLKSSANQFAGSENSKSKTSPANQPDKPTGFNPMPSRSFPTDNLVVDQSAKNQDANLKPPVVSAAEMLNKIGATNPNEAPTTKLSDGPFAKNAGAPDLLRQKMPSPSPFAKPNNANLALQPPGQFETNSARQSAPTTDSPVYQRGDEPNNSDLSTASPAKPTQQPFGQNPGSMNSLPPSNLASSIKPETNSSQTSDEASQNSPRMERIIGEPYQPPAVPDAASIMQPQSSNPTATAGTTRSHQLTDLSSPNSAPPENSALIPTKSNSSAAASSQTTFPNENRISVPDGEPGLLAQNVLPAYRGMLTDRPADSDGDARQTSAIPGQTTLEGVQIPSLSIEKVAPREIQVNQPAEFKIVVRNLGRVPANDVRVFDQIPTGAEFVSAIPQPSSSGDTGRNLEWQLGTIKPGDDRTIQLQLRPVQPGEIGSVAQVTFATPASMRTMVTKPQLSIEHSGPDKVMIGDRVSLEIQVRNEGNGAAKGVIIQENVPSQLKFADDFRELEYEIGTLGPGQSRKITLTLAATQVGRFKNIVVASGAGGLSSQHGIDMEVIAPNLALSSDGPNRRYLKRDANHTFVVKNSGTAISTNLDLIAKLPRGVRFVSADNQGQYDPGSHAVYWSLDKLNIGQNASVSLTTSPVETGQQDIEFIVTADLQQKTNLRQPMMVEHLVDVFFEIDDLTDQIEVNSETQYRIRLVNQGTKPASDVRLAVACDPGIRPIKIDGPLPGEVRGQEVIFGPLANLNPGEELIVLITAMGASPGEHRVVANLQTADRELNIGKEESTRVYSDR